MLVGCRSGFLEPDGEFGGITSGVNRGEVGRRFFDQQSSPVVDRFSFLASGQFP